MSRSLVFLNRFYWPDHSATAQMLTDLTEDLAAAGWDVSVITSRARYDGGGDALSSRETHAGVKILRVGARSGSRHSTLGRLVGYLRYVGGATRVLLMRSEWDAVVAMSDPPLLVVLAATIARLRRRKTIYWVQDVFPQIAEQLGALRKGSVTARVLRAFSRWANSRCDLVIAVGERMAEEVRSAGAPDDRTVVVHNWADGALVRPVPPRENPFTEQHDLRDKFVVMYSGNAGRAHLLDSLIRAAAQMKGSGALEVVFIGGGARIPELRALAAALQAPVRFMDYEPRERLAYSLSAATVSVVAEDPSAIGMVVPSKVYGILASGRPIVFLGSAESDVARIVRENDCGWTVGPTDVGGLVALFDRLRTDPAAIARAGNNSRRALETTYDRRIATARWCDALRRLD